MRIWITVGLFVIACGKSKTEAPPAPPSVAKDAGAAADAPVAFVLDDKVAVVDEEPCTDDCEKKCAANQLSACVRPALKAFWKEDFAAACDGGYPMGCVNMKTRAPADAASWETKEKAAQAKLEEACKGGDAWSCMYARVKNPYEPFYDKACELGLAHGCVEAAGRKVGPDSAEKGRHFALMFGRLCKEKKDPRPCSEGARFAAEVGDTSSGEPLRKRGLEIAKEQCAGEGDAAVLGCAWERSLSEQLGDKAGGEKAFARAVELADKQCKGGSLASCRIGGALYAGLYAVSGTPLDAMRAPERPTNLELGKAFMAEACRLAWRADPKAQPRECTEAENQGIDLAPLMPRGAKRNRK